MEYLVLVTTIIVKTHSQSFSQISSLYHIGLRNIAIDQRCCSCQQCSVHTEQEEHRVSTAAYVIGQRRSSGRGGETISVPRPFFWPAIGSAGAFFSLGTPTHLPPATYTQLPLSPLSSLFTGPTTDVSVLYLHFYTTRILSIAAAFLFDSTFHFVSSKHV